MTQHLINTRLQNCFYFLFCLPVFFILHGYNEMFGFLEFSFVSLNLGIVFLFLLVTYATCQLFFKDNKKAALYTFFLFCSCLFFGSYYDFLKSLADDHVFLKYRLMLPFLFFLFVLTAVLLKKTKKNHSKHIQFINILLIVLLIVELADSISKYYKLKIGGNLIDNRFTVSKNYSSSNIADSLKPDIFFLVFDELASSNGLLKHIGKGNKKLDSILLKKDFFIVEHGRANYNMTMYSVSTTFNMEYLPIAGSPRSDHTKYYFSCFESLLNNSLTDVLKTENYSIHQIQNLTFSRRFENEIPYFNDFKTNHFFYKTLFGRIKRDIGWVFNFQKPKADLVSATYEAKDRLIKKQISAIKNSCNPKGEPKFVYAHFMLPHILYIYDSIGNVKHGRSFSTGVDDYYQQLLYTNKLIKELVEYIQANNKQHTIIIIEGDHGYHAMKKEHSNYYFENFNAFYFPDKDYKDLYDSITPVNTFRIILNKYFSANLTLLKDSSIYVQ